MALLDVILGYDCNLFCDYCTITPAMRKRALSPERVVEEMRSARAAGYDEIQLTGGEPTIRPDLLGIVRAAKSLGFQDIKIQSNGLMWGAGNNLSRAIEAGANRFAVSIHTHAPPAYDALVGREGAHEHMESGLRALVASGVETSADVIVKADTYRRLPAAMEWLHGLGVPAADLWFISLTDGNRENIESMPRMSDAVPHMAAAFEVGRRVGMTVRSLHVPRCLLGADADHAWDPGNQRVRVVTPDAVFDLDESKLSPQAHVPACDDCAHRPVCPGVRRDYLERFGDEEIARVRGQASAVPPARMLPVVG